MGSKLSVIRKRKSRNENMSKRPKYDKLVGN
jgi:hypothetical protein